MKFLYPIKKLNIKPWIKYWLLKKGLNPIVLSELIEGTTPITIEKAYEGTTLQKIAFKGQTIQDRIVKGDNYININEESYRVDLGGKNLYNDILRQGVTAYNTAVWSSSNTRITSTDWIQNVKAGTYTISAKTSTTKTLQISMVTFNTSGVFNNIPGVSGQWKTMPFTFTIPIDMNLKCNIKYSNETAITPDEVTNVQLEEGSQATEYSPYVANPIELTEQDKIWNDGGVWRLNNSEITNINLIEQLEAIKNATLISGTNEITQLPSDLPFILNFKYYMKG